MRHRRNIKTKEERSIAFFFRGKSSVQLVLISFAAIIPLAIFMAFWQVNKAFSALNECEKRQEDICHSIALILSSLSNENDKASIDFSEKCVVTCPLGYRYRIIIISNTPLVYCPLHGNLANKTQSRALNIKEEQSSNEQNGTYISPEIMIIPAKNKSHK